MAVLKFQCPSCGASLIPGSSNPVMSCPYCHTSVVVAEALRQASDSASWPTLVFDNFSSNENNWLVGNHTSRYFAPLKQVVAEGRYRWEAQVRLASTITTAWLMDYPVTDFHLTANGKHITGSREGSSWGVIFRIQDNHNFYWFHVTDSQKFALSVQRAGKWLNVVDWSKTQAIKPSLVNQVEVIGRDSRFVCRINGQTVSEVEDDTFRAGFAGLAIEAYIPGETVAYDFMDLVLRAP